MSDGSVLLVDDDPAIGDVLGALLGQDGVTTVYAPSAADALRALEQRPFDVVISDVRMPDMDGMQLLGEIAVRWPDQPVIMLTAHGTVPMAVEAMKSGAREFLLKPFDADEVTAVVRRSIETARLQSAETPPMVSDDGRIYGESKAMRDVQELIDRAARSSATVLVRGESGTGKELVARAVHDRSARAKGAFVKLHCAALPDSLLESELFGYEKGAFTGAVRRKPGRVELADGGTLFLDEIGDVPLAMQVKLLRVIQGREYERLGGTETLKADVRFVAATHRDLEAGVAKGTFREDLFYRLNVVPIHVAPLRERLHDVALLSRHFCARLSTANARPGMTLDDAAVEALVACPWPGNVRQLQNFVERLVVFADGLRIGRADVDRQLEQDRRVTDSQRPTPSGFDPVAAASARREAERQALVTALHRAGNNRTVAARLLGVSRRTLYNRLADFGLA